MIIQTKRLSLRALHLRDAARLALLAGDFDVARMTAVIPYPYSEQQAAEWVRDVEAGEEGVVFGIERDELLIGCTAYRAHDASHAEIGYWIGRPYWGHGYATEAVEALIGYAFWRDSFAYLIGGHFEDNSASARVMEKLGFIAVGEEMRHCQARDREQRALLYRLTREQAEARLAALSD